ncbi:MAG: hypothetical protein EOO11_04670 [Chitinophagaceae bacterium]|nr:MAG: hypothetical protein EOO11_04670 [Chitinophagaceae bacterium]
MKRFLSFLAVFLVGNAVFGQWQWLNPLPSDRSVTKVAMGSAQGAFLLNDYGDLFRTAQPGAAWSLVQHFPGAFSMDFRGNTGVVGGWGDALYSTRDGGAGWTRTFVNTAVNNNSPYFYHVQVLPGDTIIAVDNNNSTLHRSNDGGRSWTDTLHHFLFNNANQIEFVDTRVGFIAGYDGVHRTLDGGRNWEKVSPDSWIRRRAVRFFDRGHGVMYQDHAILKTANGGASWTATPISFEVRSFYYDGPDTVYAGAEEQRLYRSLDGGSTWADISQANSFFAGTYNTIAFRGGTGYAAGSGGRVLHSSDAGTTWRAYGTFHNNVHALQFPGGDRAYALTDTALYRSDDRGLSWRAMTSPGYTAQGLAHTWFRSADTGMIFSRSQLLHYRTTDGGASWTRVSSALSGYEEAADLDIVDNRTAFICIGYGWSGLIMRSTDGGESWQSMGRATGATRIDFVDGRTGFALADRSILRTVDSGRTWQPVYSDQVNNWSGIYFRNASTGYVFGMTGQLKKTTDGGNTWTSQPAPSDHLEDLFFFNDQYGYLDTEYSGMYRTFDGGGTWHHDPDPLYKRPARGFTHDSLVYIGGYGGAILRAPVKGALQDSLTLTERTACSARLSSWVSAAFGSVDGIWYEYGTRDFTSSIAATPFTVSNGSVRASVALPDLASDSVYRVRVRFVSGGQVHYSPHLSFRTYSLMRPIIYARNDTLFSSYWQGNQWYLDGIAIPGATDRILVPGQRGRYSVQATEQGCLSPMSEEHVARLAGPLQADAVQVFPNPARGWLQVRSEHGTPVSFDLRSVGGLSLRTGTLRPGSNRIPLHGIAPGLYLLAVSDGSSRPVVKKVICQ